MYTKEWYYQFDERKESLSYKGGLLSKQTRNRGKALLGARVATLVADHLVQNGKRTGIMSVLMAVVAGHIGVGHFALSIVLQTKK